MVKRQSIDLDELAVNSNKKSDTDVGTAVGTYGDTAVDTYGGIHVDKKKVSQVRLRMPRELLDSVDVAVANVPGVSRNTWLLLAINEKLKRE